jgi:hypothetical protein
MPKKNGDSQNLGQFLCHPMRSRQSHAVHKLRIGSGLSFEVTNFFAVEMPANAENQRDGPCEHKPCKGQADAPGQSLQNHEARV